MDPGIEVSVLADEPDRRILACAVSGDAQAVVTGDRAMLEMGTFEGVRILALAEYLAI